MPQEQAEAPAEPAAEQQEAAAEEQQAEPMAAEEPGGSAEAAEEVPGLAPDAATDTKVRSGGAPDAWRERQLAPVLPVSLSRPRLASQGLAHR